jgi:large subunit ribosomal protein L4
VSALDGLTEHRRQLVVLERDDALTWLSLRNVASVHLLAVDQLNTYDVLLSDDVVFTKGAYDAFVNGTASTTARKATIVEAPGNDAAEEADVAETSATEAAEVADADAFEGSALPLESGEAPEGFEIKGNKDSMKYHAPGGQWYDTTTAEVWFRTAADAEAAGFVEAGSKKSVEQTHAEEEGEK